ncbi:unnamed protein product [Didymodactylos carnosus]|uniref:Tonsoku-like protein n=1 Tax=Didymodactylos carnosus TaxID=1234261 RepID=A0A8S2CYY0_9BILA|nr:unnamed protein product [Didymodactylos carnosus]CAF3623329.1 unnamed protein product [Didymodactylos carnosus]
MYPFIVYQTMDSIDDKKLKQLERRVNKAKNTLKIDQLGMEYFQQGKHDEALEQFEYELKTAQDNNLEDDILLSLRRIGDCYVEKNKFRLAESSFKEYLKCAQEQANDDETERAFTSLAVLYLRWYEYMQEDILCDDEKLLQETFNRSYDAAYNSLLTIEKLDKLHVEEKKKMGLKSKRRNNEFMSDKDYEKDLALRRVRTYINMANAINEKYSTDNSSSSLHKIRKLVNDALTLAKKFEMKRELGRLYFALASYYQTYSNFLQKKVEIVYALEQALDYYKRLEDYVLYGTTLIDAANLLILFDDYAAAKDYFLKVYKPSTISALVKENMQHQLACVQRLLNGIIDTYKSETDIKKKLRLAEKIGDIYSDLKKYELAKDYYSKQLKHAQEVDLNEKQMATIYSSLGLSCMKLHEWQNAMDYFRRELSYLVTIPQSETKICDALVEIIKCEYRLKISLTERLETIERAFEIAKSSKSKSLIRETMALLIRLQKRDPSLQYDKQINNFIKKLDPPINEDNCSDFEYISNGCSDQPESDNEDSQPVTTDDEDDETILNSLMNDLIDEDEEETIIVSKRVSLSTQKSKIFKPVNRKGEYPLHVACQNGNYEKVVQLVNDGHPVNCQDNCGWYPLHEACNFGHVDIVRYLLNSNASVNVINEDCLTPLHDACENGHIPVIELLLEHGAKPEKKRLGNYTALDDLNDYQEKYESIDPEQFEKTKNKMLELIKKKEPNYTIKKIVENTVSFDRRPTSEETQDDGDIYDKDSPPRIPHKQSFKSVMDNVRRGIKTNDDIGVIIPKTKHSIQAISRTPLISEKEYNIRDKDWAVPDSVPIIIHRSSSPSSSSSSCSPNRTTKRKKRCEERKRSLTFTTRQSESPSPTKPISNRRSSDHIHKRQKIDETDTLFNDFDNEVQYEQHLKEEIKPPRSPVFQLEQEHKSLAVYRTPSTISILSSSTEEKNSNVVYMPVVMPSNILPSPFTSNTKNSSSWIIRCLANKIDRKEEDRKIRIPILPSATIRDLSYQVLKRLYDQWHIQACNVTLYDQKGWDLYDDDIIQDAFSSNDTDIKAIYTEKNPANWYEQTCKANNVDNNLDDRVLEQLGQLSLDNLKSLSLSKNKLTSSAVKVLCDQKSLMNLSDLDLSNNDLTGDELFEAIVKLKSLERLNLSSNKFKIDDMIKFFVLSAESKLNVSYLNFQLSSENLGLTLIPSSLFSDKFRHFIQQCKNLKTLVLSTTYYCGEIVTVLHSVYPNVRMVTETDKIEINL